MPPPRIPSGRASPARDRFALAQAMHRQGRLREAGLLYQDILRGDPRHADALHFLGLIELQTGQPARGTALIEKALALQPHSPEALANLAIGYIDLRRSKDALAACDQALALRPDLAAAHDTRGQALRDLQRYQEALAAYDRVIALQPGDAGACNNRGNVLRDMHRFDDALASYDHAIRLEPGFAEARCNRAIVLQTLHRCQDALEVLDTVITLVPTYAEAHASRGNVLLDLQRPEEALASLDRAIALKPDFADAWNSRGNALRALRQEQAALTSYRRAIALAPDYAAAHYNTGNTLLALRQEEAALPWLDRALALRPDDAEAHRLRGLILVGLRRYQEALESYRQAEALAPDKPWLQGDMISVRRQICDWSADPGDIAALAGAIAQGRPVAAPFIIAGLLDSPALHRRAAEIFTQAVHPPKAASPLPAYKNHPRIRLGYFSADFRDHAMMHVMLGLFRAHDRQRFELTAFSFGPDTGDDWRRDVIAAFDRFLDVREMADRDVAMLARDLEIDIAIDLMGFTLGCRPGIFSHRAAPLQVNYLGYPGTMGAGYMDYIVADPVIAPAGSERFYAEKLARLAFSYQPNTRDHPVSGTPVTRRAQNLPDQGFVFCCFNNTYKITPLMFDLWLRLLQQVKGSVLWLYGENAAARTNLRDYAAARGIGGDRLVFAAKLPLADHLARQGLADLFLDTTPYNGHATASLALWAGVPVLTRPGATLASRVAASLLTALQMPELIAESDQAYLDIALGLAADPDQRRRLRDKTAAHRQISPLFDTALFARHLEAAFTAMHARAQAALPPAGIRVDALHDR